MTATPSPATSEQCPRCQRFKDGLKLQPCYYKEQCFFSVRVERIRVEYNSKRYTVVRDITSREVVRVEYQDSTRGTQYLFLDRRLARTVIALSQAQERSK